MKVYKITPINFASNSYILTADDKTAVVIDPAEVRIYDELTRRGLKCMFVLLTHGHLDHIGGAGILYKNGAEILCGAGEDEFVFSPENFNIFGEQLPDFKISRTLSDGEKFSLCGIDFTAISTPGHTVGGTSYLAEGCLFTGDTLFRGSIGRTDLPTGNFRTLMSSLKKLFSLEGDYTVYCGHEDDTTLDKERKTNPFAGL